MSRIRHTTRPASVGLHLLRMGVVMGVLGYGVWPGRADTEPVLRKAQAWPGATMRNRAWNLCEFVVENPGSASGVPLRYVSRGPYGRIRSVWEETLWSPPGSRQQFRRPLYTELLELSGEAEYSAMELFSAEWGGEEGALDRIEGRGALYPEQTWRVCVADARLASSRFLDDGKKLGYGWSVSRLLCTPENVPVELAQYAGIDIVLLDLAAADAALSPMQVQSLCDWVSSGGRLLTYASNEPAGLPSDLEALLPARMCGGYRTDHLPGERSSVAPLGLEAPREVWVTRLLTRDGRILQGRASDPQLVGARRGLGWVGCSAFDVGSEVFQTWTNAATWLCPALADSAPAWSRSDRLFEEHTEVMGRMLSRMLGRRAPPRRQALLPALIYIVLTVGLVLWFGHRKHVERAWLWAAAVSFLTALVLGLVQWRQQQGPGEVSLAACSVALGPAGGMEGRLFAMLGVTTTRDEGCSLQNPSPSLLLRTGRHDLSQPVVRTVCEASGRRLEWSGRPGELYKFYGLQQGLPFRWPSAACTVTEQGVRISLTNTAPRAAHGGFFKWNRLVVPLGPPPSDGQVDRLITQGLSWKQNPYSGHLVLSDREQLEQSFLNLLFPSPTQNFADTLAMNRRYQVQSLQQPITEPMWGLWYEEPFLSLGLVAEEVVEQHMSLALALLTPAFQGPVVTLPCGVLTLRQSSQNARIQALGDGVFEGQGAVQLELEYALPSNCPDLLAEEIRLFFTFSGSGFTPTVYVRNGGDLEPVTGNSTRQIEDPQRFLAPGRRSIELVVDIASDPGEDFLSRAHAWRVDVIDLEVRGRIHDNNL